METVATASDGLKKYIASLENNVVEFEKRVAELERNNQTLEQENSVLQEKLKLALCRQFGRHAERFVGEGQLALFDSGEAAAPNRPEPADERETVKSYQRSKRGRKPIDEHIPRVDAIIDLPEADKQCVCGSVLTRIGEDVTERLALAPEQVYVACYHAKKYTCHECEDSGDEDQSAVRTGKVPANIIPGSIATSELLSYVFLSGSG
jgi:hypothetical protein